MPETKAMLLSGLPPEWPDDPLPEIQASVRDRARTVFVLDDDPTGTQTVYDVPVLTTWSEDVLRAELEAQTPTVYILTNSRSLTTKQAQALNLEIGTNMGAAAAQSGRDYAIISRSDSTLRGHYPAETDALNAALGNPFDHLLIIPAFFEGGRYTINDVHYVADSDVMIPGRRNRVRTGCQFWIHGV